MFDPRAVVFGLICAVLAGCSNTGSDLSKPTEIATWPALQSLQNPDVSQGIIRTTAMGDLAGHNKAVTDPKFKELVDKFESEEIPSKFKTPGRDEQKKKVAEIYRSMINGGSGSPSIQEAQAKNKSLMEALAKLTDPELK